MQLAIYKNYLKVWDAYTQRHSISLFFIQGGTTPGGMPSGYGGSMPFGGFGNLQGMMSGMESGNMAEMQRQVSMKLIKLSLVAGSSCLVWVRR